MPCRQLPPLRLTAESFRHAIDDDTLRCQAMMLISTLLMAAIDYAISPLR